MKKMRRCTRPAWSKLGTSGVALLLFASAMSFAVVAVVSDDYLYRLSLTESAAVEDSSAPELQPIPDTDDVSVVWWVKIKKGCVDCPYFTGKDYLWVTLKGEVQSACRLWKLSGGPLVDRVAQLLGLPPRSLADYSDVKMVTLKVPRNLLRRPCLAEVFDRDGKVACSLKPRVPTSPNLETLVRQKLNANNDGIRQPGMYPFTGLGYTYDWHPSSRRHIGVSEFVIEPHTRATILSYASTEEHCNSDTGK
jgi:hypothetical protein